jgi:hypothetical protein
VPAYQQSGRMVQVRMVMGYLTADGSIRGFAEALVLAEASVEAGAEAVAGLDFGGRSELAGSCRKDGYYAKR